MRRQGGRTESIGAIGEAAASGSRSSFGGLADVAGAGAHQEFLLACPAGGHSNRMPGAGLRRIARNITEGVLIANLARDAFADRRDTSEFVGEEGFSAGCAGETAEHAGVPVGILIIEDAD